MEYDQAPEHVRLAVELIRRVENAMYDDETVVESAILVIQDTLNKMNQEDRILWRNRLSHVFGLPDSLSAEQLTYSRGDNDRKSH